MPNFVGPSQETYLRAERLGQERNWGWVGLRTPPLGRLPRFKSGGRSGLMTWAPGLAKTYTHVHRLLTQSFAPGHTNATSYPQAGLRDPLARRASSPKL